jgi:choice-of-anchor A domain-containing protein
MKFNHLFVFIPAFSLFSVPYVANAGLINLGTASNYNAFVHQNFSAPSSDVEGRLAAGGNIDIANYSVNIKGSSQLYTDTHLSPALVTGGDLNFSSGQIAGNVFVGGNYTPTATGSITNGIVSVGGTSPIDFDVEFTKLNALSSTLASISANSVASDLYSTQHLVGLGSNGLSGDLHVFNLDASDMNFSDYLLSGVDKGDTVLLNIAGKDITTSWGNFGGSDHSLEAMSDNILFNFFEAETLNINAAIFGSILAPKADIKAPGGVIWGQVIANSWDGNTQINDNPFVSNLPEPSNSRDVPEPSILLIFSLGLLTLIFRKKRCSF